MDPNWSFHSSDHHQQLSLLNTAPHNQQQPKGSNLLSQQLRSFWQRQQIETEQAVDFRNHSLPLARIKKIMKADDNVHMISSDAPVLLAKACEMFIQDLTLRSWSCTEETKRKTLQKSDIPAALSTTDLFDFLVDIVPRDKPIASSMVPMNPTRVLPTDNSGPSIGVGQQHMGYNSICEHAGLTMGLQSQVQVVQANQLDHSGYESSKFIPGSWPGYMSHQGHQPAWPPPEF